MPDRACAERLPGPHDRARSLAGARGPCDARAGGGRRRSTFGARRRSIGGRRLGRGRRRVRLRAPRCLAVPSGAAEGPRRPHRSRPRGNAARLGGRSEGGGQTNRCHLVHRCGRQQRRDIRHSHCPSDRGGLDRPGESSSHSVCALQDDRRAGGLGPRTRKWRFASVDRGQPQRDPRPGLLRRFLVLAAGDRKDAEGDAGPTSARVQLRRRPRRRRPAGQSDDGARGGR